MPPVNDTGGKGSVEFTSAALAWVVLRPNAKSICCPKAVVANKNITPKGARNVSFLNCVLSRVRIYFSSRQERSSAPLCVRNTESRLNSQALSSYQLPELFA